MSTSQEFTEELAAHQSCNLLLKRSEFIPVFFHNLQKYDSHLFIKELANEKGEISAIPVTEEKYISFSKEIEIDYEGGSYTRKIRFLDTLKFLSSSLDVLSKNLTNEQFIECDKLNIKELLRKKGIFPYEYIDSFVRCNEPQLAPIEKFYSILTKTNISNEEYKHTIQVWNECNIKILGEYHDFYVKTDVILICDVFKSCRKICLNAYG